MGMISNKLTVLSGLKVIGQAAKMKFAEAVGNRVSESPLLNSFFESELGSPIEKEMSKLAAFSLYKTVKSNLPGGKVGHFMAEQIAKKAVGMMDWAKVSYQYHLGKITGLRCIDEYANRICASTATFVEMVIIANGNKIAGCLEKVLVGIGMPDAVAKITRLVPTLLVVNREKIRNFIKNDVPTFVHKTAELVNEGANMVSRGLTCLKDKAEKLVEKVAVALEKSVDKVITCGTSLYNKGKDALKSIGNWALKTVFAWH